MTMHEGDRVLTPDLRLATIVNTGRTLDKLSMGKVLRGEAYAVVEFDDLHTRRMHWQRDLVPAPDDEQVAQ